MALDMKVGLGPGHIVLDGDAAPSAKKATEPPIFGPYLLWPKCWMDEDTTWYIGRPQPRRHCVRWGTSSLQKGHSPPPIFRPCLLWPNGWMDEDATCYGSRPRLRPHSVRQGASPPLRKGHISPLFAAHVYCGHGRASQLLLSSCTNGRPKLADGKSNTL